MPGPPKKPSVWDNHLAQDILAVLAAKKLSASKIAEKLSKRFDTKVTRNSVVGKAYRTGIDLCGNADAENGKRIVQWDSDPENRRLRLKRQREALDARKQKKAA